MKFLENLKMKKLRKGQKGFTLIELLVVIAILGVIAAVAVPNILSFMDSGSEEAARAEQHNMQVAVAAAMYAAETGTGVTFDNNSGTGQIWTAGGADTGSPSYYLINDTKYEWAVSDAGVVTPSGTDNPLTPAATP
jgi:type IV pilus assembly protein PilA